MTANPAKRTARGTVYLVGAGPGDPDLLTIRAMRLLSTADVLVYDRLISREVLDLVPVGVDRIPVGKSSGHHSVQQDETNRMLAELAQANRMVVRLKGGDPFVFGRGSEEAMFLSNAGISYEVVPGITAAVACTAYAGIPLTHRGISQGFRVVTGHLQEHGSLSLDWRALADPKSTLVIYMGLGGLKQLAEELISAGLSARTAAAAIENGTTRAQRVVRAELQHLPRLAKEYDLQPPTLIVIGKCVELQKELAWFGAYTERNQDYVSAPVWAGC